MKYVLVTGAGGGMGQAVVDRFISGGYRVFAADLKECAARENVIPLKVDVTDEESVKKAFDCVCAVTDVLFAIVHLAGIYAADSLVEMPPEKFGRAFKINVGGVFLINRTFFPLLKGGSKIIAVTSELAALDPLPFTGIYGITKTALDKYAYSLRMELQLLGISVSVLRAGAVDTGMLGDSTRNLDAFCAGTKLYRVNAEKFKAIVDGVESKKIPPKKIAEKLYRISCAKKPKFSYSINRNKLLILLDALPVRVRFSVIRRILKSPKKAKNG